MHRPLAVFLFLSATVAAFAAADTGLLSLVPSDAKVVSSVNVQQALVSPFGQYLLTQMNSGPNGFDQLAQETGFDPRRDLQSFVFASSGAGATKHQSPALVIARGTFQADLIRKHILAHGGTAQSIAGLDVFIFAGNSDQQSAYCILDTGIAVFGDLGYVKQAIANRSSPTVLDPSLQSLISKVSADNDAWFASILGGSYLSQHMAETTDPHLKPQAQALQGVRQAAGGVQLGDPLNFSFDAVTRSPQDAISLVDVARFMASFVQMQRQKDPQLEIIAQAIDGMTLNSSGDNFHASLSIPEKSMEQLADSRPHHGFKAAPHHDFTPSKPLQR